MNKQLEREITRKGMQKYKIMLTLIVAAILIIGVILLLVFTDDTEFKQDSILEYQTYAPPYYASQSVDFTEVIHDTYDGTIYSEGSGTVIVQSNNGMIERPGTQSKEDFKSYIKVAISCYYQTGGLKPSVTLGQMGSEQGWDPSKSPHGWNLFGLKAKSASLKDGKFLKNITVDGKTFKVYSSATTGQKYVYTNTKEEGGGSKVETTSAFVYADTPEEGAKVRAEHMLLTWPEACNPSLDAKAQLQELQSNHNLRYATASSYVSDVYGVIKDFNFEWLDDQIMAGVSTDTILAEIDKM